MRPHRSRTRGIQWIAFGATAFAIVACSGSDPDPSAKPAANKPDASVEPAGPQPVVEAVADGGAPAGSPIDEACAVEATAYCSAFAQKAPDVFATMFFDAAYCVERNAAGCKIVLSSPDTGWTTDARRACAAAWSTATAEQLVTLVGMPAACRAPAGKRPDGATCGIGTDCASRACVIGAAQTCGVCAARAKAGGACLARGDCDDDFDCNYDANGVGTCGAPKSVLVPIGTPCSDASQCGLRYCRGTWVWSDGAQSWSLTGGTCQGFTAVGPGSACGEFTGASTATTVPVLDIKECARASTCKYPNDEARTGTCVALPTTGQACDPAMGCGDLSTCTASVCVAMQPTTTCK